MKEDNKIQKNEILKHDALGKFLARIGTFIFSHLATLRYHGVENVPSDDSCVLAANHQSFVDALLIAKGLNKTQRDKVSAIAAADLATKYGLFGKIMLRFCPIIPVDRSSKRSAIKTLIKARNACQAGNIVLVHPEGTRTSDGLLGEIQSGAAYIAQKANKLLVPVYIAGAYKFFSRHMSMPRLKDPDTKRRHHIDIYFLEPLNPADFDDVHALNNKLSAVLHTAESKYLR